MQVADYQHWAADLKALHQDDFPKRCACCGRIYHTEQEYFSATQAIRAGRTGLKPAEDDDAASFVELYRNCACGSTLMAFFGDRRDLSVAGLKRRQLFAELLEFFVKCGMQRETACAELLKVTHGQTSELLDACYARNVTSLAGGETTGTLQNLSQADPA
ncbi:MAG: oxidoreductase [Burkholderiales bacterium]|nr:oxidoreductase [Burkholderiales bacterium]